MDNLDCSFPRMTEADFQQLWQTPQPDGSCSALLEKLQQCSDHTPATVFGAFENGEVPSPENPLLRFYDRAFEKVLSEAGSETVKPGEVAVWYLYNMGYVIKTPESCFGLDIHHRFGEQLADLLDFAIVTHNHDDHYNLPLLRRMTQAGKGVISSFFPNPFYTKAPEYTHVLNDVTLHCGEADHNAKLRKFTMPVEIICRTGDQQCVIFSSGDCCSHEFLEKKSPEVDLYILHLRCGMSVPEAADRLDAKLTLVSHLLELGHEIDRWRWPFALGVEEVEKLQKIDRKGIFPVWGQKMLWRGPGDVSFS